MGDTLVTEISGIGTLTAGSFDFVSTPKGSSAGPFWSVAHIQGIGIDGSESGWVAAPEPSSLIISLIALLSLSAFAYWSRAGVI